MFKKKEQTEKAPKNKKVRTMKAVSYTHLLCLHGFIAIGSAGL